MRFASLSRDNLGFASCIETPAPLRLASTPGEYSVSRLYFSHDFADSRRFVAGSQIIYEGRGKTDAEHNSKDCAKRRTEQGIVL